MTETPDEQRPRQPRIGTVYQRAVESVLAVVVAVLFGAGADYYFESSPIGVLLGLGIGFGSMILGLTRLMRDLAPPPPQEPPAPEQGDDAERE